MKVLILVFVFITSFFYACSDSAMLEDDSILGYSILEEINGHWVGTNETAFGNFSWFAFDYRPISASHSHSIYEGATGQNIITSLFVADFEGKQQIMARNGGWLGNQYRATYFVLDIAETSGASSYYRLVDAVGREKRAYKEFRFENGTMRIDAYKDNSGSLDEPIHHMGFVGTNKNPEYSSTASTFFDYPKKVSEVNLNDKFNNLIDNDSALFLDEASDPFPRSAHGYLSELSIEIQRNTETLGEALFLYISKDPLVDGTGNVDLIAVDNSVIRTINIASTEEIYNATYLHPDDSFLTVFSDQDGNSFPSSGDISSVSVLKKVGVEKEENIVVAVDMFVK